MRNVLCQMTRTVSKYNNTENREGKREISKSARARINDLRRLALMILTIRVSRFFPPSLVVLLTSMHAVQRSSPRLRHVDHLSMTSSHRRSRPERAAAFCRYSGLSLVLSSYLFLAAPRSHLLFVVLAPGIADKWLINDSLHLSRRA